MHPDLESRQTLSRRLRELRDATAPPYDWREFERRSRERVLAAEGLSGGGTVALTAVLVLGILALWIRMGGGAAPGARPQALSADAARVDVATAGADADRAQLPGARSARLESWLESLPSEPAVVRVGTHAAVTGLEDRIAQLDDLLSLERLDEAPPARLLALQQERTRLVGVLVQVRYAETLADESR